MYGDTAFALIKELDRHKDNIPTFDENALRQIFDEMQALFEQNQRDVAGGVPGNPELLAGLHLRHAALERNKQCVLAYLYNRVKRISEVRWNLGSVLPANVRLNMTEQEIQYFNNYNKIVAGYMQSLGEGHGLDLTQHSEPPKNLMVEVRVMEDYGEFESDTGETTLLKKNTIHLMPRSQCESLIRQGVLEVLNLR